MICPNCGYKQPDKSKNCSLCRESFETKKKGKSSKLNDEKGDTVWASDNKEKALEIVKNETSQKMLAEIAKNAPVNDIRIEKTLEAVRKITQQPLLYEIIIHAKNFAVRQEALKNLTDQNLLADLVKSEQGNFITSFIHNDNQIFIDLREHAIFKLTDQKLLYDISINTERYDWDFRNNASKTLKKLNAKEQ